MKKLLVIILVILLLSACGNEEENINENSDSIKPPIQIETEDNSIISEEKNQSNTDWWMMEKANNENKLEDSINFVTDNLNSDTLYETLDRMDLFRKPLEHTIPKSDVINSPDNISVKGKYAEFLPPINNSELSKNLITECQGIIIRNSMLTARHHHTESGMLIHEPNGDNPYHAVPTFLRLCDNGIFYTIRKYNCGGYLYEFYDRPYSVESQSYLTDDKTDIVHTGGVYVENILSYSDFSEISVGDSIKEVEHIDSATTWWLFNAAINSKCAYFSKKYGDYVSKNIITLHLLTDGLLTINYSLKDEDYIITDIVYSEDYTYYSDYLENEYGGKYPKQFKILPQDFPPAE